MLESTMPFMKMTAPVSISVVRQACQDAIAGRFPNNMGDIGRLYQLSEGIHVLQKRHNDFVHEANQALYRVQQSWHTLSEAYAAFFNGEAIPQEAEEPS